MITQLRRLAGLLPPEGRLVLALYPLLLALFALLRLALLVKNFELAAEVPAAVLRQSFLVGLRFDLAISSYLLMLLFLTLLLVKGRPRRWVMTGFSLLLGGLLLLGLAEAEFYREFQARFNGLVYEYLGHPVIVGGMIWDGYPVLPYLLIWAAAALPLFFGIGWLSRRLLAEGTSGPRLGRFPLQIAGGLLLAVLMVFACRGGIQNEPLRWGDAFFSQHAFANHLACNGFFTLARSGWDKIYSKQESWAKAMPKEKALALTREMVLLPGDEPLQAGEYPLLRRPAPTPGLLPGRKPGRPVNVVVILMESFSGRFTGALGAPDGLTPDFDRLADQGVLFERAFSSGTHTHQGVYSSLTSFPNLPGYEYLMKMMEANQEFSSLPMLLDRQGYQTLFLYNGLFSWDNKEGFFRQHGMERFIGTEKYENVAFRDPVWGVSDQDVYHRANEEFRAMAEKGPFFSVILTLSNHAPFNLPEPLPFPRIITGDDREGRHNGMRYADWALGEFFRQARQEDYFRDTLFVVTGDHAFGGNPPITPMGLSRFHVPLLFYAPSLLGETPRRLQTVANQVDIIPSILALLDLRTPHQSWGRNLFSPALKDEGHAVIKPSGGEDQVAYIEGDYILIQAPRVKPELYRFSLDFPPRESGNLLRQEPERAARMEERLQAFVETALVSLRSRKLGVPTEAPLVAEQEGGALSATAAGTN